MDVLKELLDTIKNNSIDNKCTIENVDLFVKSWTKEAESLQLRKADVSGCYSKDMMISSAKYGYEYHANTSFPKQSFEQCCKNNFLQHLTLYDRINNNPNKTICVVCGKRYPNPNKDSDTCYECREPHCK